MPDLPEPLHRELCHLARCLLNDERTNHTLDSGAVVGEAYIRLEKSYTQAGVDALLRQSLGSEDQRKAAQALWARTMRRVLIDYARERNAEKRPNSFCVHLPDLDAKTTSREPDLVDALCLDEAFEHLAEVNADAHKVAEMHLFGGFALNELAAILGPSYSTIRRRWKFARFWLRRELHPPAPCQPVRG